MGASTSSEIHDFTGGLANVQAPHLIAGNEAQQFDNIDITLGSLASIPKLKSAESFQYGPHFFYYLGVTHNYGSYRSNVLWNNKWYWTDGTETRKMTEDGVERQLGLETPETILTLKTGWVQRPHTGNFKYTYTFYDANTDTESAPAPLSEYIGVENKAIMVDNFQDLPVDATHYRLYRIGGYLTEFTLVVQLTPALVPFNDTYDETQIDGRLLQTLRTDVPPINLNFLTELNGRFYGAVGTVLYWSVLGNPDAWYIGDFINFADPITALAVTPSGLIVTSLDQTHVLRGSDVSDFVLRRISDQVGCSDFRSIAYVSKSAIWFAKGQWVMTDGNNLELITYDKIDFPSNITPLGAEVVNNVYHMAYGKALYPSNELFPSDELFPNAPTNPDDIIENSIVTIDFKRGNGYSFGITTYESVEALGVIHNTVNYGRKILNNNVPFVFDDPCEVQLTDCQMQAKCSVIPGVGDWETYQSIVFDRAIPDYSAGLEELVYLSPKAINGSRTNLKEYDKIRLVYRGNFLVQLYAENGDLIVEDLIRSDTSKVDAYAMIGIPNKENKSYSITAKITGKGVVDSIQYTWKGRELA